ncbi:MAG: hypothetical protein QME85_07580 [Candidatus Saccharicenans sp.]|nr:hypothetical protein [Candidatus Saccharicenans sp.]
MAMVKLNRRKKKPSGRGLLVLALWLVLIAQPTTGQELVNCLLASVDHQPVTSFDLEVLKTFQLLPGENTPSLTAAERLDRYIDVLLVLRLTREQLQVSQEEVRTELDRLRERLGSELFEQKCLALGLKPEDLEGYLQDKILFEKVIGTRFNQRLYVSLKEIEDYYQQVYMPEQRAAGKTPAELVSVLDEIESRLQARRREERVKEWTGELKQRAEIVVYADCLNRIK